MADSAWVPRLATSVTATTDTPRHTAMVRVTHWITALCFFALLVSGIEIVISHPRFYWGETGNILTPSLFDLPIPSSRSTVPTGYEYVLPDQNGWSRYLHFQSAWVVVAGHFRKDLMPSGTGLAWSFKQSSDSNAWSYNVLQRLTYLFVIFVLFPLVIWTGLAMSPAVTSAIPTVVTVFGGQQSARTIHFFVSVFLVLFLLGHIGMVCLAGFRSRMRAMITGRVDAPQDHS